MKSTPITTKDGKELVLFHEEDITQEEIELFQEFTLAEIKMICKLWGFTQHKLGD